MSDKARDARAYILAATICFTADLSSVREEVTGLRLKGQRKVHWRDESDKRRRTITECIALLPLEHVMVVRKTVSLDLRVSHADALGGATVKQRTGDATYLETIQARAKVRIIQI